MQHDIQLSNNNSKELISFEQLRNQVLLESEKKHKEGIISYLKENKKSLLSVHKFLGDYSGELTDELIMEKLTDDAKHLLQDIADSKEKCYLGLYKIKEIKNNNLYNTKYFWNWAETVTTITPYTLQNRELDLILIKSIKELKDIDDQFNDIILITQNNASSNSLKVYNQLLIKLKSKFDEIDNYKKNIFEDDAKFSNRKEECRNNIIQQVSQIFESINHIVEHHSRNHSYEFYFDMNPEEIEQICKISKEFKTDNTRVLWLEPLLNNLISYYVTVAKEFSLTADIGSLCDNWKLTRIFSIVYDYSNNNELKEKILDSFSVNNAFLPYLPLDIIESTFNQKDDIKQGNIIYYLEQRYDLSNEREKKVISSINDKIILDMTKNIELREKAFNWIFDKIESKDSWCQKILTELLEKSVNCDFEIKPSFTKIIKKCFTAIQDKDSINNSITKYLVEGKNKTIISFFNDEIISSDNNNNATNQLQDVILKLIKTNEDEKTIELCKYITKLSELGCIDSVAGRQGIEFICKNYGLSEYKNEINEVIRKIYLRTNDDEAKTKLLTEIFKYIKDLKNTFLFSNMIYLFKEENSENLNFLLLKEFFECKLPNISIQELEKYINYIWDRKNYNQTIVDSILESICKSENRDMIKYVVLKGWRK